MRAGPARNRVRGSESRAETTTQHRIRRPQSALIRIRQMLAPAARTRRPASLSPASRWTRPGAARSLWSVGRREPHPSLRMRSSGETHAPRQTRCASTTLRPRIRTPLLPRPGGRHRGTACGDRPAVSLIQPTTKCCAPPHRACSLTPTDVRSRAQAIGSTANAQVSIWTSISTWSSVPASTHASIRASMRVAI